jgi:hypothetical protein
VSDEDLARVTLKEAESEAQRGGFVALCSSSMSEPSVILPKHTNTYFTEALLQVLKQGDKASERVLSFSSLCNAINSKLLILRENHTLSRF